MNKKGYIGAIGDDLPSLIPIFLGITIFFAVFLSTYNVYRNNTDIYSLRNDAINIAGVMKEEPLIADHNQFNRSCGRINTKYNWNAFITPFDLNSENYQSLDSEELIVPETYYQHWEEIGTDRRLVCNFEAEDLESLKTALETKDITIYKYPITVQQEFYAEPAWLYVAIWK